MGFLTHCWIESDLLSSITGLTSRGRPLTHGPAQTDASFCRRVSPEKGKEGAEPRMPTFSSQLTVNLPFHWEQGQEWSVMRGERKTTGVSLSGIPLMDLLDWGISVPSNNNLQADSCWAYRNTVFSIWTDGSISSWQVEAQGSGPNRVLEEGEQARGAEGLRNCR